MSARYPNVGIAPRAARWADSRWVSHWAWASGTYPVGDPEDRDEGNADLVAGQGHGIGLEVLYSPAVGQPQGEVDVGGDRADRQHVVLRQAHRLDQGWIAVDRL